MTNATDLSDAFTTSSGGTFLNKDDKAEVFAEQTPMYVMHVEPSSDGVYGAQTIFHVKAQKWGKDETKLLAFAHNEHRQRLAEAMLALMNANPGRPGGPIFLWKFITKSGNEAWDIKPAPYVGPLLNTKPIAEQAAAAVPSGTMQGAVVSDDDLPFAPSIA